MNTTRMVAHVRGSCTKCSPETKTLILQYYGNGTEKYKHPSKFKIPAGTVTSKTAASKNKCINLLTQNNDNRRPYCTKLEDWNSTAELFRRINQIPVLSNLDVPQNDTEHQINTICKYEENIVDDTVDITSDPEGQNETDFSADIGNLQLPSDVPQENNENGNGNHQPDIKAFSEFVHYELETIKNLEIVNELKHDICNLLYIAKKQYLQNKK